MSEKEILDEAPLEEGDDQDASEGEQAPDITEKDLKNVPDTDAEEES